MQTLSKIIEQQIRTGYRLSSDEIKLSSYSSLDQYIKLVAWQQVGLKLDDMDYLSAAQEKTYKGIRNVYFAITLSSGLFSQDIFFKLTDLDQRLYVKCLARKGRNLPNFLTYMQPNRYWYNLWYREANKENINDRIRNYWNSRSEEDKALKRIKSMESTRNYLLSEKGKARTREYYRNYYKKKRLLAGKTVRPYLSQPEQFAKYRMPVILKWRNFLRYLRNKLFS